MLAQKEKYARQINRPALVHLLLISVISSYDFHHYSHQFSFVLVQTAFTKLYGSEVDMFNCHSTESGARFGADGWRYKPEGRGFDSR